MVDARISLPNLRGAGSLALAIMLAWIGGCDIDAAARSEAPLLRVPRASPQSSGRTADPGPAPCGYGDDDWYGCPGNPCAHGWCFVGKCVGEEVGRDGTLVDPGVCCVDGECLEIDP